MTQHSKIQLDASKYFAHLTVGMLYVTLGQYDSALHKLDSISEMVNLWDCWSLWNLHKTFHIRYLTNLEHGAEATKRQDIQEKNRATPTGASPALNSQPCERQMIVT